MPTFQEVAKMFDGDRGTLPIIPVESTVACLSGLHLLGKKLDWVPRALDVLLEYGPHCRVRCVGHKAGGCIWPGV